MENILTLSDLLFPNQYRRKVLALLMMNPHKWVHLRELARMTEASPGTLKKELDALSAAGLLKQQKMGNQTQFSANTDHPVYPELSGLIRKTTGLTDVLTQALQPLTQHIEVAFVFGSMAEGTAGPQSDVDLLVIGTGTFGQVANAVHDAQSTLAREINPKVMSREEWNDKKNAGNSFVQDILSKPKLFVFGGADEL